MLSLVIVWIPRRGLLAMYLVGARVELIHPVEQLPAFRWSSSLQAYLARNRRQLVWLGTDDDVGLIGLSDMEVQAPLLRHMPKFPNATTLILQGPLVDSMGLYVNSSQVRRVFIEANGGVLHLDWLRPLASLQELKVRNVQSWDMSDETAAMLNRLHRIDVYDSDLSPRVFIELAKLREFTGTLAFQACHGIDDAAMRQLSQMQVIRLELKACFGIGDDEIRELKHFPRLRFLQLSQTHVSEKEMQRLQKAMPLIQIDERWSPSLRGPSVNGGMSF